MASQTDFTGKQAKKRVRKKCRSVQPPLMEGPFWALDDTRPAGPYEKQVDDDGLSLLCLSMIRQALMDERYFRGQELMDVRAWLGETAGIWLKVFGYWRNWENEHAFELICQKYSSIQSQLSLPGMEETTDGPGPIMDSKEKEDDQTKTAES